MSKKYLLILLFLIIAICTVITVSAMHVSDSAKTGDGKILSQDASPEITLKAASSKTPVKSKTVVIKPEKLSATYKSGKYFKAKLVDSKTKKPVKGVKVILKVYTGKKAKTVTLTSNSKGVIKYSTSKLNVGKHKVTLKVKKSKNIKGKTKTSSIIITQPKKDSKTADGKIKTYIEPKDVGSDANRVTSGGYTNFRLYFTPYLYDSSTGKPIEGSYDYSCSVKINERSKDYNGNFGENFDSDVITSYDSGYTIKYTIKFSGNDKYAPCTYSGQEMKMPTNWY